VTARSRRTPKELTVVAMHGQYASHVHAYVRKAFQGDTHTADDIVAETFFCAFNQYDRHFAGKSPEDVAAMLYTIAKRRIIDQYRKDRKELRLGDIEIDSCHFASNDDPLLRAVDEDTWRRFWTAVAKVLTRTENQVAWLSWQAGMSDQQIAKILGIPTMGTVRTHRSRAKTKIILEGFRDIIFPDDSDEG
jgi:RNA polymerase sigma factor (sigma-70 family)